MIRERSDYGMPIKFELIDKRTSEVVSNAFWTIDCSTGKPVFNKELFVLCQAIGATDSSDPKQELYLRDVVRIELQRKNIIAEIVWYDLSVCLRFQENNRILYFPLGSYLKSNGKITKLASRYTKEGKEILKKAGLE